MSSAESPQTEQKQTLAITKVVEADRKLKRELGFLDLLGLSMGGIIGSGWLFAVNAQPLLLDHL
jgi:amino acid permease